MTIHNELQSKLNQYFHKGLFNTIFYGSKGVGKHNLILNMLNYGLEKNEIEKKIYWENSSLVFYSTSRYIRFDAKDCNKKNTNLVKIIEEISRTKSISDKYNKIIYIRYLNYLGTQQDAFRQLLEDTYSTCRYVFTCRNIDTIDKALHSRCLLVRIPSPSNDSLLSILPSTITSSKIIDTFLEIAQGNISTFKNLILLYQKAACNNTSLENYDFDIYSIMAKKIQDELISTQSMSKISKLAEKYHFSEFSILDICQKMENISEIAEFIKNYSIITNPTSFDTIALFANIVSSQNINIK